MSIQQRHRSQVAPELRTVAARYRRLTKRFRPKHPSDVRYRVYVPPLGSLARQLLGAREIKLR